MKPVGTNVLLVGLSLQLATFSVFLVVMALFVKRANGIKDAGFNPCLKKVIAAVWAAGFFVQVRDISPVPCTLIYI